MHQLNDYTLDDYLYGDAIEKEPVDTTALDNIFRMQAELMDVIGIPSILEEAGFDALMKEMAACLVSEAAEVQAPMLNLTKPWKVDNDGIDMEHIAEETVDILFFLVETWILLGMTPQDVENVYVKKSAVNLERIAAKLQEIGA